LLSLFLVKSEVLSLTYKPPQEYDENKMSYKLSDSPLKQDRLSENMFNLSIKTPNHEHFMITFLPLRFLFGKNKCLIVYDLNLRFGLGESLYDVINIVGAFLIDIEFPILSGEILSSMIPEDYMSLQLRNEKIISYKKICY
jgi:hypothetical protein